MVNSSAPSAPSALVKLQDKFAIANLGGELRVVDQAEIKALHTGQSNCDLSYYKKSDAEILMKRLVEALPVRSNPKQEVSDFWVSPSTVVYTATAFTPEPTPATTLNFWTGPVPTAKQGSWDGLRDYILDIICAGDIGSYEYLIRYMAHMIQKPEEKPGVLIALLGGQGTGKGVYFSLLRAIWPRTTLLVSDIDEVTGRFNASLERNYIIFMDEALFAGDRKSMDRLKSTVTEPQIRIEQKYQPTRTIGSVHRFFAASNHDHFAHVEKDDRRFFFLRVSAAKQQNTKYFGAIADMINDPATIGALVYDLQHMDLTGFDVRRKPGTGEHLQQKIKSLQGFERFWFEVLQAGDLSGADSAASAGNVWQEAMFVSTASLLAHYKEFNKNAQRHSTLQSAEIVATVRHLCPSASPARQVCRAAGIAGARQQRGLDLPDLATARSEFRSVIGGDISWD